MGTLRDKSKIKQSYKGRHEADKEHSKIKRYIKRREYVRWERYRDKEIR